MTRDDEYERLIERNRRLISENERLRQELEYYHICYGRIIPQLPQFCSVAVPEKTLNDEDKAPSQPAVTRSSSVAEKISLFRSLFKGREDVYARRWYSKKSGKSGYRPVCLNEWRSRLCDKSRVKCSECKNRLFAPLDDETLYRHLSGQDEHAADVVGIYPVTNDDGCYFLAFDFDGKNWQSEVGAVRAVCDAHKIPALYERSRSGQGGHVWLFFEEKVKAAQARRLGACILNAVMEKCHTLSFSAYDRMFPNQDYLPQGGLGNLIALPLQGRARREGNSVFIDENFVACADQWSILGGVSKISPPYFAKLLSVLSEYSHAEEHENTDSDACYSARGDRALFAAADLPSEIEIVLSDMVYILKEGMSERALACIKRMSAYPNPDFFRAQRMRLPTYDKPRYISVYTEDDKYVAIPRGRWSMLRGLLKECGVCYSVKDERNGGVGVDISFSGELREEQQKAFAALNSHDIGVLSATTAFGKTVVGAMLIAEKKRNALVLVHTSALLNQWKAALNKFLVFNYGLPQKPKGRGRRREPEYIGQLGATKNTLNGKVDIAIMQSLADKDGVKDIVKNYGLVIVDECHHVPAFMFEQVLKSVNSKYVYGLTATPFRADGRQESIFMLCGDISYRVDALEQAKRQLFAHVAVPRFTNFRMPLVPDGGFKTLNQIFEQLCTSRERNLLIIEDVVKAVNGGHMPIVLTERTEHAKLLTGAIERRGIRTILLVGKESAKTKREKLSSIASAGKAERFVIVAVGKYVGEGFDFARLDTLFLAMPISWKGKLAQYVGRLHRDYIGKKQVTVYDYVDLNVAMLENMYRKRLKGYAELGYEVRMGEGNGKSSVLFDKADFARVFAEDILSAHKCIFLACPTFAAGRIAKFMRIYAEFIDKPDVTVLTNPSVDRTLAERLESVGVKVVASGDVHTCCAVIADSLVWYGSISPLGYAGGGETMLRFDDREIAAMLKDIAEHKT